MLIVSGSMMHCELQAMVMCSLYTPCARAMPTRTSWPSAEGPPPVSQLQRHDWRNAGFFVAKAAVVPRIDVSHATLLAHMSLASSASPCGRRRRG